MQGMLPATNPLQPIIHVVYHFNDSKTILEESLANGHKYSEEFKVAALNQFLAENIGKCSAEIISHGSDSLSFDERCAVLADTLMQLGVKLPMNIMEDELTDGQIVDRLYGPD
ncbi:hypothetical protein ACJU26_03810 [Acidithiobacillus sp. M4-SHS-6]|uniref:hypothetical protein n=1 Tax=Acidithiobacillus sp. M4-SHS-6 TaxID=3383024 RepID=UPI0039BE187F